ncbi:hypothetical protein COCVIDRAFT_106227 [Bipolaris victoriae FI3]|uniref:Uncharacterized protein n=1 Tax=Bipolaris victoriae (strain FI3) TaxID=930091 RepID=W7EBD8_BIPV3|nr:hypothetical protein COCVIDRAFT_106227 [Bipolaris victoriae FI3]
MGPCLPLNGPCDPLRKGRLLPWHQRHWRLPIADRRALLSTYDHLYLLSRDKVSVIDGIM